MTFFRVLLALVFVCGVLALNADYEGAYSDFFFGRQPSARAEALGRGYVTINNDLDSYFFNPAGIAGINSLSVKFSTSSPYYGYGEAQYYQLGLGYNLKKYFVIGFNVNHMDFGDKIFEITTNNQNYLANYVITLATHLSENFLIGYNLNYFTEKHGDKSHNAPFLDAGIIYNNEYTKNFFATENNFSIGASIKNFTFSKVKDDSIEEELPVLTRLGLSYSFIPDIENHFLKVFLQAEYKYLLNYKYLDGFHTGLELEFFDIIAIRTGYYNEDKNDYGSSQNKDKLSDFTYGFGVTVPIHKFIDFPVNLHIDYTTLEQVNGTYINYDFDRFHSITMKINWVK